MRYKSFIQNFKLNQYMWLWEVTVELNAIEITARRIIKSVQSGVIVIAAAKTRTLKEIQAAIEGGIEILGYNYVQEAVAMHKLLGNKVKWHMIGHLQRNKAKSAVKIYDMIETIDSVRIAREVDKRSELEAKVMPVLIEINSGKESNKTGVLPKELEELLEEIKDFSHLKVKGLMTMGPRFGNPEDARPYFQSTKLAFDKLKKANIPNIEMKYLSMGMSNTYKIAIEEGANIIRVGSKIFCE